MSFKIKLLQPYVIGLANPDTNCLSLYTPEEFNSMGDERKKALKAQPFDIGAFFGKKKVNLRFPYLNENGTAVLKISLVDIPELPTGRTVDDDDIDYLIADLLSNVIVEKFQAKTTQTKS